MAEKKRKGLLFDEVLPQARRTAQSLLSLDPQEDVPASQQALEMALGFVPGIGQAMALRDIERARRAQDPTAGALAAASLVPFGRLLGKGRSAGPIMSELDVYHGTPHRFPATEANPLGEFDASKIGTGEGAQAYGHGIYLAESPGVAESYKQMSPKMLPVGKYAPDEESAYYAARVVRQMGSPEKAIEKLAGTGKSQEFVKAIKDGSYKRFYDELPQASLYKADLPDEMIDRMLDWDQPLSKQPAAIQEIARKIGIGKAAGRTKAKLQAFIEGTETPETGRVAKGGDLYLALSDYGNESVAGTRALQEAGILGIKYKDAGSRGQGGSGTRNFVVFPGEEKKVKILERK